MLTQYWHPYGARKPGEIVQVHFDDDARPHMTSLTLDIMLLIFRIHPHPTLYYLSLLCLVLLRSSVIIQCSAFSSLSRRVGKMVVARFLPVFVCLGPVQVTHYTVSLRWIERLGDLCSCSKDKILQ